jgi:hypothetical protein
MKISKILKKAADSMETGMGSCFCILNILEQNAPLSLKYYKKVTGARSDSYGFDETRWGCPTVYSKTVQLRQKELRVQMLNLAAIIAESEGK